MFRGHIIIPAGLFKKKYPDRKEFTSHTDAAQQTHSLLKNKFIVVEEEGEEENCGKTMEKK
jgi:hypothetical protein